MKWIALFSCIAVVGCNSQDAQNLGQDVKQLGAHAGQAVGGMTLVGKVNMALDLRKDVDISGIHVEAKDGIVTISGHVKTPEEKRTAVEVAEKTKGVDKVVDTLRVEP